MMDLVGMNSEFPAIKRATGIKPAAIASATEIPNGSPATLLRLYPVLTTKLMTKHPR